jgi:hypothetical protein
LGSGIRDGKKSGSGIRDKHPGSATLLYIIKYPSTRLPGYTLEGAEFTYNRYFKTVPTVGLTFFSRSSSSFSMWLSILAAIKALSSLFFSRLKKKM